MNPHLKRLALAGIALLGLGLAGTASADPLNIRIAWSTMPGHMIPVLFAHKQALKHYGTSYTVEPILFRGSSPQIAAMAAGGIDMATFAPSALALAITNAHLDAKVVADIVEDGIPGYHSDTFMVRADSDIKTVADLKGKRIGSNAIGSSSDIAMRVITAKTGLKDHRDFTVFEMALSAMPAMLHDEKIDLGTVMQPFSDIERKSGRLRVLFTTSQAVGPSQLVFLAARADFLAAHHDQLADFFEDYIRAFRWYTDPANKAEAVKLVADFMKAPPEDFAYLFTKDDYYRDPYMVPNVKYIQTAVDAAVSAGALTQGVEVAPAHVDLSYILTAKARVEKDGGAK